MPLPNHTSPSWPGRVPVPFVERLRRWVGRPRPDPPWLAHLRKSRPEFLQWSLKEASRTDEGAALFLLGVLRDDWRMRAAFPLALSGGADGGIGRLLASGSLPQEARERMGRIIASGPGKSVLNLYLHDTALQGKIPDALLPAGKIAFFKWLCNTGLKRETVRVSEILWFMQQTDESPGGNLRTAYLINPAWQEQFPDATTPDGWNRFTTWCKSQEFGLRHDDRFDPFPTETTGHSGPGVNVLGHFCFESGLHQAALHSVDALSRAGARCSIRDIPVTVRTRMIDRTAFLGLETHPVSLVHFTPNPFYHDAYGRAGLHRRAGVYRIGLCSWELPQVPAEWVPLEPQFDEIWAYTRFIADALGALQRPVRHVLPGVRLHSFPPLPRSEFHLPEERFMFLFLFDMCSVMERKNPLGLITAFREAFPANEPVALAIKVSHAEQDAIELGRLRDACKEAGVHLIEHTFARAETCALINCCDAYVSLHRCEGFGLTMAEAMLLGKPVIATNYSGNLDFMHSGNSLLVDWKPATVERDFPNYPKGGAWAEPDTGHAARLMRWVFENQDEARQLGATARKEMEELLSVEAAGNRMMKLLQPFLESRSAEAGGS